MSSIALVVLSIAGAAFAGAPGDRLAPWRIERDVRRFRTVATDNVMNLLALRPRMTILDLGAGTGQFAYEFARRLNGTGKVYATDTNASCVDYMREESGRRGLRNLHAVLVDKDGVDAFYRTERFDLIAVFHVLMPYESRVEYLRELRTRMAEGGRLVLVLYKAPTPFSPDDFTADMGEFAAELAREPAGSPYFGILRESTRTLIRDRSAAEASGELGRAIAADFNEVLADTRFSSRLAGALSGANGARFLPEERAYADWALYPPPEGNVAGAGLPPQRAPIDARFSTINKLLIVQKYRRFLKPDRLFASGLTAPIRAAFEKAGYRLVRERGDLIPFGDIAVFAAR